ncbi:MAG: cupin domain-containing protein [Crocinitomicaceae bacterium]
MNARVKELVEKLQLHPHPEGGYYKETYRSIRNTHNGLSLMTSIYFLLTSDSPSRFHRIQSDEHWYFHEGSPLSIHLLDRCELTTIHLGLDLTNNETPHALVKGNTIFGSEIEHNECYALVSCAVSPGFDFSTFELFTKEELLHEYSDYKEVIERLT